MTGAGPGCSSPQFCGPTGRYLLCRGIAQPFCVSPRPTPPPATNTAAATINPTSTRPIAFIDPLPRPHTPSTPALVKQTLAPGVQTPVPSTPAHEPDLASAAATRRAFGEDHPAEATHDPLQTAQDGRLAPAQPAPATTTLQAARAKRRPSPHAPAPAQAAPTERRDPEDRSGSRGTPLHLKRRATTGTFLRPEARSGSS
jgi:hypothetical protein